MFGIKNAFSGPKIIDRSVIVVFVIGGISFQEIQEISQIMSIYMQKNIDGGIFKPFDIIIGSTSICTSEYIFQKLFFKNL